jgi:hypothetical protein
MVKTLPNFASSNKQNSDSMNTQSSKKNSNNNSKKVTMATQKFNEANARRKVAMSWAYVACGKNYKQNALRESEWKLTQKIEKELFDGIFLTLKERHEEKSYRVRKRMLRRIIEKRQAQSAHKCVGRTNDRLGAYLRNKTVGTCIKKIHKHQQCA